jgi:hypothetical protein
MSALQAKGFISRSTVQRATSMPLPLRSSSHIFRAPQHW